MDRFREIVNELNEDDVNELYNEYKKKKEDEAIDRIDIYYSFSRKYSNVFFTHLGKILKFMKRS